MEVVEDLGANHEELGLLERLEKVTDNVLALGNHLTVLTGEKLYKCSQCTESFVTKGILH
jgi:hypothetical protein